MQPHPDIDELDTLRPLGRVDPPDDATLMRARSALDARLAAAPSRRWAHPPLRRAGALVAGAAAPAAAIVLPSSLGDDGGSRPAASESAETFLRSVARTAARQDGDWKDAAYWYSSSRHSLDGKPADTREVWLGHRSPGRYVNYGRPSVAFRNPSVFDRGFSWDDLWTLPTDAEALKQRLSRRETEQPGQPFISQCTVDPDREAPRCVPVDRAVLQPAEVFRSIGALLTETPAPPALRAALYEVAADLPGVRLVGPVKDAAGRTGTAVELTTGQRTERYVIHPADGRLLESTHTWDATDYRQPSIPLASGEPGVPPEEDGTAPADEPSPSASWDPSDRSRVPVTQRYISTYLVQGPVDSVHDKPSGER